MEAILDFTHNTMSKIVSCNPIMSGIYEKSWICLYSIENYINIFFDLGQNGGHFGFLRFTKTLLKIQEGSQANVD